MGENEEHETYEDPQHEARHEIPVHTEMRQPIFFFGVFTF